MPRPFREGGIGVLDVIPIPPGKDPPRFDTNPERIMVRSRGQAGATAIATDVDAVVTGMSGVLDYFSGTWALLPDAGSGTVVGGMMPRPVSDAAIEDATIASFNLQRFFDDVRDGNGAPTLTTAAFDKRLTKTSLAICDSLKAPDILGVVEAENMRGLQALADRINTACTAAPLYQPYLIQGNDVGGINVGFLVNARSLPTGSPRVEVVDVAQFGKDATLPNPDGSSTLLNDRPPLRLKAIIHHANGAAYPVTVIVNHLRSLNGIDDTAPGSSGWSTYGARVRAKRAAQAAYLAGLVEQFQQADPNERIVLLGDFNAFEFNDGYADVMGIIRGDGAPEPQVLAWYQSPVTRPLIDGSQLIVDPLQRYSYVFEGNAQTLDHVVLNEPVILQDYARVEHARINADFGVHWYGIPGVPVRTSDHDPVRLAISVNAFHTADLGVAASAPASLQVGGTAQFGATITNAGPGSAINAAVAFVFDALVDPMVNAPAGWTCNAPVQDAAAATTSVTCRIPELAANSIAPFTIDVPVTDALRDRTLRMAVSATSQARDPEPGNNGVVVSAIGTGRANVWSHITGRGRIVQGQSYTYTMRVANNGPHVAWMPVAKLRGDAPAADVTVLSAPEGWTCSVGGDATSFEVTCNATSLAPGIFNYVNVKLVAPRRTSRGQYLNLTSEITSLSQDVSPANNTDSMRALVSGTR